MFMTISSDATPPDTGRRFVNVLVNVKLMPLSEQQSPPRLLGLTAPVMQL